MFREIRRLGARQGVAVNGVVVVGTGFIAGAHLAALAQHPTARLAGVVDTDAARAAGFAHVHGGVAWTTDLAEAISWDGVVAAVVCTPNASHAPICRRLLAAGLHVLVEKPLATTVTDARELVETAAARGLVLAAAHTHRCYDYGRAVQELLRSGALGQPLLARLAVLGDWIWPDWGSWIIDPQASGGHALHNGVHLLDLVTWWLDQEPVEVYARGHRATSAQLQIHDQLDMTVTYAGGAVAVCEMSRGHRTGSTNQRELVVLGTAGSVEQEWDDESAWLLGAEGPQPVPAAVGDGFARQLAAWWQAIEGGVGLMPATEALRAVALGVAVERSIAGGAPVRMTEVLDA